MDIQMPEMGGVEATHLLRERGFSGPIIALTANVLKRDTETYLSSGFDNVLAKPIERREFYGSLAKYLPVLSQEKQNLGGWIHRRGGQILAQMMQSGPRYMMNSLLPPSIKI